MSVVVHQHVSLHGGADIGAADGIAHVQRFEQWELLDPIESGVVVSQHVGALDTARQCVAALGQAVLRVERLTVGR